MRVITRRLGLASRVVSASSARSVLLLVCLPESASIAVGDQPLRASAPEKRSGLAPVFVIADLTFGPMRRNELSRCSCHASLSGRAASARSVTQLVRGACNSEDVQPGPWLPFPSTANTPCPAASPQIALAQDDDRAVSVLVNIYCWTTWGHTPSAWP